MRPIDVLELIETQHAEIDRLIERLASSQAGRARIFQQLADKLAAHVTMEERVFYREAMRVETEELLQESFEEHLALKRTLAAMLELDPDDDIDEFDAQLAALANQVSRHAHDEEEGKLFPVLRRLLTKDQRVAIGNECRALFELLLEQAPRTTIAAELGHAAPLPAP